MGCERNPLPPPATLRAASTHTPARCSLVYAAHIAAAVATSDLCLDLAGFVAGATPPRYEADVRSVVRRLRFACGRGF